MVLKNNLIKQILRFGIVGSSAALVNFSIVILLVEIGQFPPLTANVIAFAFAFHISYFGHRYWTFHENNTAHRIAAPRLLAVSSMNFIANEGLFYIFLNTFELPYPAALLLVLAILPVVTFTLGRLWVFR